MRVVVISGYFNPLHTGHLDYIECAQKLGDTLVVIVNNDKQVVIKGSSSFMNESARLRIAGSVKGVSKAILSIDQDGSVVKTLESIWETYSVDPFFDKMIFANGGDRKEGEVPEVKFCEKVGIKAVYGVGGEKVESSSNLIRLKATRSKIRGM